MIFKSILLVAASAAAVVAPSGAFAQSKGDWVLGRWKGGAYWYPAVIQRVDGDQLTLQYDDGDRETTALAKVRPYDWTIGKKVECNFQGKGDWYPGTISSLGGEAIGIAYDDGDKERTKTGRCRSR
ncbi:tudor domain-containing protein [Chelatococcus sambhunathii]|uniref:tudor domain-containing protein n=1 Tax=Chelatococcus sambhunathii TaxID=363953 RepID=UPI002852D379|nr:tudor domain-containing protein [Chelatococcus sambhunathii]